MHGITAAGGPPAGASQARAQGTGVAPSAAVVGHTSAIAPKARLIAAPKMESVMGIQTHIRDAAKLHTSVNLCSPIIDDLIVRLTIV